LNNTARSGQANPKGQLAEVLVESQQGAILGGCSRHDSDISKSWIRLGERCDVKSGLTQQKQRDAWEVLVSEEFSRRF
jgi:hypothetical protein